MTGIVNQMGSVSGAVGTTSKPSSDFATLTGSETFTNKNIEATTNVLPAGSIVQVGGQSDGTSTTVISGQNQWNNTVVISAAFTPRYSDSRLKITGGFSTVLNNTSGDGGYSHQWKREYSGHNSTPTNISTSQANNRHSMFYRNPAGTNVTFNQWHTFTAVDSPATTSAITYRLQSAYYNAEGCGVGAIYGSRWFVICEEIKT